MMHFQNIMKNTINMSICRVSTLSARTFVTSKNIQQSIV